MARAAIALAPDSMSLTLHPIADVPFYNGDVEERGLPASVVELNEAVDAADGVIFFTPEYNTSLPAVTKNIIDWLSRPPTALVGTPLAAVASTPGGRAGAGVLGHFADIFDRTRENYPRYESLGVGNFGDKLDESGELADPETRQRLEDWLVGFEKFIESDPGAQSTEQG